MKEVERSRRVQEGTLVSAPEIRPPPVCKGEHVIPRPNQSFYYPNKIVMEGYCLRCGTLGTVVVRPR